jgi:hypothetical protein
MSEPGGSPNEPHHRAKEFKKGIDADDARRKRDEASSTSPLLYSSRLLCPPARGLVRTRQKTRTRALRAADVTRCAVCLRVLLAREAHFCVYFFRLVC